MDEFFAELTVSQGVRLASLLLSIFLGISMLVGWCIARRLSQRYYQYLLYYALYVFCVNIPKLALYLAGAAPHSPLRFALDCLEIILIWLAATAWTKDPITARQLLYPIPGIAAAMMHHITGSSTWAMVYAASIVFLLILTVYYISRNAPWFITLTVSVAFLSWMLIEAVWIHGGDPVGHAFGMVVKVSVFGAITLAHYERQHRHLWQAAMVRKMAIQAAAGDLGPEDLVNGGRKRLAELCGYSAPN